MSTLRNWRDTPAGAAYLAAHKAHEDAQKALIEATRRSFPIGTRVMSEQRHNVVVEGEVVAVCQYVSQDAGCVVVRNLRTGKSHRAAPFSPHGHFELAPDSTVRAVAHKHAKEPK